VRKKVLRYKFGIEIESDVFHENALAFKAFRRRTRAHFIIIILLKLKVNILLTKIIALNKQIKINCYNLLINKVIIFNLLY
jgi:hypothetical protein